MDGGRGKAAIRERGTDGSEEVRGEPGLDDIAECARGQGGSCEIGVVMHGEKNKLCPRVRAAERSRGFEAIEVRHADVEHDDIRIELRRRGAERDSVGHRTHDLVFALQRRSRQREHGWMIVGQQYARGFRGSGFGVG